MQVFAANWLAPRLTGEKHSRDYLKADKSRSWRTDFMSQCGTGNQPRLRATRARVLQFSLPLLFSILSGLAWNSARAQQPWNVTASLRPGVPHEHGLVQPSGIWRGLKIEVCWERDYPEFTTEKQWVREALHTTIEHNSQYDLTSSPWAVCDQSNRPRIRVVVEDMVDQTGAPIAPHSQVGMQSAPSAFGTPVPQPTHVSLNFTFRNGFADGCRQSDAIRKNCIQVIAVHEFMHALGFLHEQYNTDLQRTDPACYARIKETMVHDVKPDAHTWNVTEYDPDSIMNYCRDIYSEAPRLSKLDVDTLHALQVVSLSKAAQDSRNP